LTLFIPLDKDGCKRRERGRRGEVCFVRPPTEKLPQQQQQQQQHNNNKQQQQQQTTTTTTTTTT